MLSVFWRCYSFFSTAIMNSQVRNQAVSDFSALAAMFEQMKVRGSVTRITRGARYLTFDLRLKSPADLKKALAVNENVALGAGVDKVVSRRDGGVVRYDFDLPELLWMSYRLSQMSSGSVGMAAGRVPVPFDFGYPHKLLAGSTGSGKSVAMRSLIISLAKQFPPDKIQFGIADPHKSMVEFENAAHMVAKPATEGDTITRLIIWFHEQLRERKRLGEHEFNRANLPRLVLAIDEASRLEVFGYHKALNHGNLSMVRDIVQEGRKFKMSAIVSTQKPTEADLPGVFSMIDDRYVGKVASASMSAHFAGQSKVDAHLLTGRGDFMHVFGQDVTRFVFAEPEQADYDALPKAELREIEQGDYEPVELASGNPGRPPIEIQPDVLAHYMVGEVSIRQAEILQLGRRAHNKYKTFANELMAQMEQLKHGTN